MNDKIARILEMQESMQIEEIATHFNYSSVKGLSNYMNSNGYSRFNNKFIEKNEKDMVKNTGNSNITKNNKISIQDDLNEIKNTLALIKNISVSNYFSKEIRVSSKPLNLKPTSIRIDKDVSDKFDLLCKQYPNISKHYMYTKALEEFIEKHFDDDFIPEVSETRGRPKNEESSLEEE